MYLMIDNYDSFVYNLRAYFEEAGHEILVVENDGITTGQIRQMKPEGIIISPGPKTPKDAFSGTAAGFPGDKISFAGDR